MTTLLSRQRAAAGISGFRRVCRKMPADLRTLRKPRIRPMDALADMLTEPVGMSELWEVAGLALTGTDLRTLRKRLRLTQEALAVLLRVTRETISEHERDRRPVPRERMLAVLCLCLWAVMKQSESEQ